MSWQTYVIIGGLLFLAVAFFYGRRNKGTKVIVQWHKLINGNIYQINPHKKYVGINKSVDGIEKFFLPKVITTKPQEGLNPSDFIPNSAGIPIVHWLMITEEYGLPMVPDYSAETEKERITEKNGHKFVEKYKVPKYQLTVIEKDVQHWADNEKRAIAERNKGVDQWAWLKQTAPVIIVAMICLMMFVYSYNRAGEAIENSLGEVQAESNRILDAVTRLTDVASGNGEVTEEQTSENAEKPPQVS